MSDDDEDRKQLNEAYIRAGFNAGWTAACLTTAHTLEKEGHADAARLLRDRADKPTKVAIVRIPTQVPTGPRTPTPGLYPDWWPRCACGDWCMDGKATCGRVECLC